MKKIFFVAALAMAFAVTSCSEDDQQIVDETKDLKLVQTLTNDTHTIELFTNNGTLAQGHNQIWLRFKNKSTQLVETPETVNWKPIMHMTSMNHSCPYTGIEKSQGKETLMDGSIVFQMPDNETEYWELTIDYSIDGNTFTAVDRVDVPASEHQRVTSFMGTDNKRYIMALIDPAEPQVAANDLVIGVYQMQNMMNFPQVNGYSIVHDPRMPSMGNHSSPRNINCVQGLEGLYYGTVSLTMTGYWKFNLMLYNDQGTLIKGEEVTEQNESSSLYFEVEF